MVQVSKQGSATSTITESGKILGPITRGRLLRAGVRVPYYIKGDPAYSYTRTQTVTAGNVKTEVLTEEKWRVTY